MVSYLINNRLKSFYNGVVGIKEDKLRKMQLDIRAAVKKAKTSDDIKRLEVFDTHVANIMDFMLHELKEMEIAIPELVQAREDSGDRELQVK